MGQNELQTGLSRGGNVSQGERKGAAEQDAGSAEGDGLNDACPAPKPILDLI
jgi:hypothetical protein